MSLEETLTSVIAAFVARIWGRGRSALGTGGGRAATWGDAAFGERSLALGGLEDGTTTGGVSPRSGDEDVGAVDVVDCGGGDGRSRESADIMACRCMG